MFHFTSLNLFYLMSWYHPLKHQGPREKYPNDQEQTMFLRPGEPLDQLPEAAIKNYPKPGNLKQQKCIFQRSAIWNQDTDGPARPPEALGRFHSSPLPASGGFQHSFGLRQQRSNFSFHFEISSSSQCLSKLSLLLPDEDIGDGMWASPTLCR